MTVTTIEAWRKARSIEWDIEAISCATKGWLDLADNASRISQDFLAGKFDPPPM